MQRREFLLSSATLATATIMPWSAYLADASKPLLKLSSNENPLGMSPKARLAAEQALKIAHRYGDSLAEQLRSEIAEIEGFNSAMVTLGNGSTGILEAIMRQQAIKGATLIQPAITYGDASWFATTANMAQIKVPMLENFVADLSGMEKASLAVKGPVVVYIVTPNNPTGVLSPYKDIAAWVKRAPDNVFFIIDEAYHELVTEPNYQSCTQLINEGYENLIVARTFSKMYAMAGMRLGYGLGSQSVIKEIRRHYSGWSVNVPAIQAGRASLKDEAFQKASLQSNEEAKKITQEGLSNLGLKYIPSQGNFLIHEITMELKAYQRAMLAEGIRVGRDMNLGYGWNRLSLGTPTQMQRFINTLASMV